MVKVNVKVVMNTGLSKILGEQTGVNKVISNFVLIERLKMRRNSVAAK